MTKMNEWREKQAAKEKASAPAPANTTKLASLAIVKKEETSYTDDDFEDMSVSGSGSKTLSMSSKSNGTSLS